MIFSDIWQLRWRKKQDQQFFRAEHVVFTNVFNNWTSGNSKLLCCYLIVTYITLTWLFSPPVFFVSIAYMLLLLPLGTYVHGRIAIQFHLSNFLPLKCHLGKCFWCLLWDRSSKNSGNLPESVCDGIKFCEFLKFPEKQQ